MVNLEADQIFEKLSFNRISVSNNLKKSSIQTILVTRLCVYNRFQ